MPCAHCQTRGEECVFTQPKRRGKKSPRVYDEVENAHVALAKEPEAGTGYTAEYYLGVYFEKSNSATGLLRPDCFSDGTDTPARALQKAVALATASHGCGHFAVATNLERDVRTMACEHFDDFSADVAVAFCMLSRYYWGSDPRRARHYMKLSASLTEIAEIAERNPVLGEHLRLLAQEELNGRDTRNVNFVLSRNKDTILPSEMQGLMPLVEDVCTVPPLPDITPPMDENARFRARMGFLAHWDVIRAQCMEAIRDFPRKNPFLRLFCSVDGFGGADAREAAPDSLLCLNKANFFAVVELLQQCYRCFQIYNPLGPTTSVIHAFLLSLEALLYLAVGWTSKAFEAIVASLTKTTQGAVDLPFSGRMALRTLTLQAAVFFELEQWEHLDKTAMLTQLLVPYFPAVASRIAKQMQRTVDSRFSDSGEEDDSDEESDHHGSSAPPTPTINGVTGPSGSSNGRPYAWPTSGDSGESLRHAFPSMALGGAPLGASGQHYQGASRGRGLPRARRYSADEAFGFHGGAGMSAMPSIQEHPEQTRSFFANAQAQTAPAPVAAWGKRRPSHGNIQVQSNTLDPDHLRPTSVSPQTSPHASPRQALYEQGLPYGAPARKVARRDPSPLALDMHALAAEMSGVSMREYKPELSGRRASVPAISTSSFFDQGVSFDQGLDGREVSMAAHDVAIQLASYPSSDQLPVIQLQDQVSAPMDVGEVLDVDGDPSGFRMSTLLSDVVDQL